MAASLAPPRNRIDKEPTMERWCKDLARLLADLLEYPVEHPRMTRGRIHAAAPSLSSGVSQAV